MTELVVPERSQPESTVLVVLVQVPETGYVDPMDVIFVAKQSIETSVTVLLLEHTVVELVVVRPVTSQPEIAVAWLVHVVLVALPAPVRMVQSLATWLAVIVSQP